MKTIFSIIAICFIYSSSMTQVTITDTVVSENGDTILRAESNFDFSFLYINIEMEKNNKRSIVKWRADNESGGVYYVDRTSDGINFKNVGKVSASSEHLIIDKKPLPGIFYYRIKYVDKRGNMYNSEIIPNVLD